MLVYCMKEKILETKRKIVVALASFPARKQGMLNTIRHIINQCDMLCIWLNGYDIIPNELYQFDSSKMIICLAHKDSDLKENGRYTFISQFYDSYFLTVDDDLNYPSDYVKKTIQQINFYQQHAIVAWHGAYFDSNNVEHYVAYNHNVIHNIQVHRIGGGVMGFVPSEIDFQVPTKSELIEWDGDASISVWATQHNIKKYVIKHTNNYITECQIENKHISTIGALCKNAVTIKKRTKIYSKIKQWEKLMAYSYITYNRGRLGNQLYYVLQAWKKSSINHNFIYSMQREEANAGLYDMLCELGLSNFVAINQSEAKKINSYCQQINVDFTLDQIYAFIRQFILKSNVYNGIKIANTNDCVAISIRNGDYLLASKHHHHDCFERIDYLMKAIYHNCISNATKCICFSDDIQFCKDKYLNILKNRFKSISFVDQSLNAIQQLKELSLYKNMICWNSTFSIWAAFISQVLHNHHSIIICPSMFSSNADIRTRIDSSWNIINVKSIFN